MIFNHAPDVPGKKKDAAMVFLASKLRVRLMDPDLNPVAGGRCRVVGKPDVIYDLDGDGIADIPLKDRSQKSLELEWEPPGGGDEPFPWNNIFDADIRTAEDDYCSKRLTHLGFLGETLPEQVDAYLDFIGLDPTGDIAAYRDEIVLLHDDGKVLAKRGSKAKGAPGPAASTPAPAPSGSATADGDAAAPAAPEPGDPSWPRDVMIVPDDAAGASNSIYRDNIKFAKQWVAFKPSERAMVQVGANGDFEAAVTAAAAKAKKGKGKGGTEVARKIILFIGHGGAADSTHTMTAFDTLPEAGLYSAHLHKMTGDAVHLGARIQSGEDVVVSYDIHNLDIRPKGSTTKTTEGTGLPHDEKMVTKYTKYLQLFRISNTLKANGIAKFIVLSCSVGRDTDFAGELRGILETPVGLYRQKVATEEVGSNHLIQIWLSPPEAKTVAEKRVGKTALVFDKKDRPKQHDSLHEYPAPEISK
ncbi:MAG: hypothetical protein ABI036_04770 [Fibrobacteria bacterium]